MTIIQSSVAIVIVACSALAGCATRTPTIYQWERYETNVDAYFRNDQLSADAQTQIMEEDLQKIRVGGGIAPPGYNAHLGLLYGKQGRLDKFAEQMLAEKKQYPESVAFVDFLLRNFKKK